MREPQVALPDIGWGTAWGLGWQLYDLPGGPVFGHDGNTIGQSSVLRVDPGRDVSAAIFTNGGDRKPLMKEILGRVVESPAEPVPDPAARPDARRCAGVYLSSTSETTVSEDERGRLWLEQVPLGLAVEPATSRTGRSCSAGGGTPCCPRSPATGPSRF